jgi:hypothetical protein
MDFIFELPINNEEQRVAYYSLCHLFNGKVGAKHLVASQIDWQASLSGAFDVGRTFFGINNETNHARFAMKSGDSYVDYDLLNDNQEADAIPLSVAVERLRSDRGRNHFRHLDHAGINVARDIPNSDWLNLIEDIADERKTGLRIYEYPEGIDGYDGRENLWYFSMPADLSKNRRAQMDKSVSKFELVHDGLSSHSRVQLDIKTSMTSIGAKRVFPEGFQIEGLENNFFSVNVSTPWDGMRTIRLDLRFSESTLDRDDPQIELDRQNFESGCFFTEGPLDVNGKRLRPVPHVTDIRSRLVAPVTQPRIPNWIARAPHPARS